MPILRISPINLEDFKLPQSGTTSFDPKNVQILYKDTVLGVSIYLTPKTQVEMNTNTVYDMYLYSLAQCKHGYTCAPCQTDQLFLLVNSWLALISVGIGAFLAGVGIEMIWRPF